MAAGLPSISMLNSDTSRVATNGSSPAATPIQLAIPQPRCPGSYLHIHLTILTTTIMLFVTSAGEGGQGSRLGSLVYALPNVLLLATSISLPFQFPYPSISPTLSIPHELAISLGNVVMSSVTRAAVITEAIDGSDRTFTQRYDTKQPLSTVLYTTPSSLDFATRLAKVLVRRTGKAVHVGNSVTFEAAAEGGTVEEEMEGFRRIVEVVMGEVERTR